MTDYEIEIDGDRVEAFYVKFHRPKWNTFSTFCLLQFLLTRFFMFIKLIFLPRCSVECSRGITRYNRVLVFDL